MGEHDCKEQNIMGMCFELLQKLNSTAAIGEVCDMMNDDTQIIAQNGTPEGGIADVMPSRGPSSVHFRNDHNSLVSNQQASRRADRRGRFRLHPGARPQRVGSHDRLRGGLRDGALLGRERRRGAEGAVRVQGRTTRRRARQVVTVILLHLWPRHYGL